MITAHLVFQNEATFLCTSLPSIFCATIICVFVNITIFLSLRFVFSSYHHPARSTGNETTIWLRFVLWFSFGLTRRISPKNLIHLPVAYFLSCTSQKPSAQYEIFSFPPRLFLSCCRSNIPLALGLGICPFSLFGEVRVSYFRKENLHSICFARKPCST